MKYINRTSPGAFMQLGAGLMAGDPAGGISHAGQELTAGTEQQRRARLGLYKHQEGEKAKNLTRQWLIGQGISPEDAEAAMANPAILSELLAPPAKRNLIEVDGKLYDADTDTWIEPGGAGGSFDLGTGTDARALEYLVTTGVLTERQAAEVAGGKSITMPDGTLIFKGASDLAGNPTIVTQPPGGQPAVVNPDAPAGGGGGAAAPAAPAAPAQSGGVGAGGTILSPPKSTETTEQKNARVKAVQSQQAINEQLNHYVDLVGQYGNEALSGEGKDKLNIARQGIMLQMKELYNLGVLNGPDLALMEKLIYDPVIDVTKEGGWANLPGQIAGSLGFGDPKSRAKNSADELKKQLDTIVRSKLGVEGSGWTVKVR